MGTGISGQPLTEQQVAPLAELVANGSDQLAAGSLESLATMSLEPGAWQLIFGAVEHRLTSGPAPVVIKAAAHVPIEEVRTFLRDLSTSQDPEPAEAALHGLIAVRDEETLRSRLTELLADQHQMQALMELPAETLGTADPSLWDRSEPASGEDFDVFYVVAAGKAGQIGPLRHLYRALEQGNGPSLFWGDPSYVSGLLRPARPVPQEMAKMVTAELIRADAGDTIDDHVSGARILASGLIEDRSW